MAPETEKKSFTPIQNTIIVDLNILNYQMKVSIHQFTQRKESINGNIGDKSERESDFSTNNSDSSHSECFLQNYICSTVAFKIMVRK